ncbi:MAG: hypothetical protein Q7J68_04280 [Thermoplasmata archaeon]|nr:hypothetical protein [Thermoplasmata archaeon]
MSEKKDYYAGVGPNMMVPLFTRRSPNVVYYPRYSRKQILLAFLFAFLAITFFFWFCNTFLHVPIPGMN